VFQAMMNRQSVRQNHATGFVYTRVNYPNSFAGYTKVSASVLSRRFYRSLQTADVVSHYTPAFILEHLTNM